MADRPSCLCITLVFVDVMTGALMMPDDAESAVCPHSRPDDDVDSARRHRTDYCDARQLLSETLRLRRAAQLQRAAAGETATAPIQPVSGRRRAAAADATATTSTTPKRRKKSRRERERVKDQPQPHARRIMFHEYKGPSDDNSETATMISGRMSTAHLSSSTPLCFTSPCMMTCAFSANAAPSVWQDGKDDSTSQLFGRPLTTSCGSYRHTSSSLPRFSELQRSLCSPTDFVDLASGNHAQVTQRSHRDTVSCASVSSSASVSQRSSFVDALFCCSTTSTAMTTEQVVTSSSLSLSSVQHSTLSSQSQPCHCQSMTSPIDITSGLLTSGGADHVIACFPSVTAAYRPNNGNKLVVKFSYIHLLSRVL